ncbi:hypothetical protein Tco_0908752 [Tanacetum coccineum]|uniref:Uncharacterized protein n=1 Tax=Tanacetum coccineum TaxID=301880 RepID=A0ABQ5CQ49_9ASTR
MLWRYEARNPNSPNLEVVQKNIKAIKDVIENESHLILEIRLGLMILEEEDERKLEIVVAMVEEEDPYLEEGEVGEVENKSLIGSMLVAKGEECLESWVGAGGGEVKGCGVDFGVTKSLLGEIFRESGGEEFVVVDGGAV